MQQPNQRSNRARSTRLALVCAALVGVVAVGQAAAFPSLFNVRGQSIFRRQQQPQAQQQQQQQQPVQQQQVQSQPAKDQPQQLQFSASQPLPAELMRISSMQRPQHALTGQLGSSLFALNSAASQPQQQRGPAHFIYADAEQDMGGHGFPHGPSHGAAPFYRSNAVNGGPLANVAAPMLQHAAAAAQPAGLISEHSSFGPSDGSNLVHEHSSSFDSFISPPSASSGPILGVPQTGGLKQSSSGMHLEPTHTSEIVDKIEAHIGQQIERNLKHQQAASNYVHGGEKEAAQSEDQEETAPGGGESSGADEHDEKLEKRHEEPHHGGKEQAASEKHHHHHHEEEHHHEHPPEAFEVHHKKGGKSFQYFHQGHHHA